MWCYKILLHPMIMLIHCNLQVISIQSHDCYVLVWLDHHLWDLWVSNQLVNPNGLIIRTYWSNNTYPHAHNTWICWVCGSNTIDQDMARELHVVVCSKHLQFSSKENQLHQLQTQLQNIWQRCQYDPIAFTMAFNTRLPCIIDVII